MKRSSAKKETKTITETHPMKKDSLLLPKLDWKYFQNFGDASDDKINEEDTISAIAFDKTGRYLTLGDNAGRLILFE